jgi:23S rRNA (adenine2503-C2)-methyltransferase
VGFCGNLKAHINLLKINHVTGSPYKPTSSQRMASFLRELERQGIETTIRDSRGSDIDGACGQLKNSRR